MKVSAVLKAVVWYCAGVIMIFIVLIRKQTAVALLVCTVA
jgi:hypothetical protein